ncbi:phytochrome A-associated F-box protein [Cocos nucifera]|uniref:Phytochrome A-associated F-box protein n=1 Tax=Cocos nucifera TaxID=13894 RepID=A0A8K0I6T3_COCNU|nr:phytochrome A-associated F-box protein [Cocos nucifera]
MATPSSSSSSSAPAAPPLSFGLLSDDIVLNILAKLEADPRDWARLACTSARFAALVRGVCCRSRCAHALRSAAADLLPSAASAASLHKLSVCCPGLLRAGVLLEHSDFGLERDIGPDLSFLSPHPNSPSTAAAAAAEATSNPSPPPPTTDHPASLLCWSLFDDLYFDTVYDPSESSQNPTFPPPDPDSAAKNPVLIAREPSKKRRKQWVGPLNAHLASGSWTLSREQGNKLLASRFRGDCLYICEWPGCVHVEENRRYMLFRGVFKNFKRSRVWRTITDSNRGKIELDCAFCSCNEAWDLHSAFCLRRVFGFHDDGEPVVRAYVCENGHVSGAWTERPMYA